MATKKRKKPTTKLDRAVDRLYKAVDFYVRAKGGSLVIVGGIQIQEWPGDPVGKFTVGVQCLGRKPEFPAQSGQRPGDGASG